MITPELFVEECRKYVGVKFVHQGRSIHGVDCAGLLVLAASSMGASVEDYTAYTRYPNSATFYAYISKHADRVSIGEQRLGDLIVFEFDGNPQHVAILSREEPPYIIHSAATHRKVVEHRLDEKWQAKIRAVFRPVLTKEQQEEI